MTVLLEYINFLTVTFYACTVLVMYQNNFWISEQEKSYNLVSIISRNHPIIPEYSPILFTTYYSQNYAGIIDACLVLEHMDAHPSVMIINY